MRASLSRLRFVVEHALATAGVSGEFIDDRERSDHASFLAEQIDALNLTTGEHFDYHKVGDIAARINVRGLGRVIDLAESIVRGRDEQ